MLLNTKSLLIATKEVGFFCPKMCEEPAPSNVFWRCACTIFDQVKHLRVWIYASLKDDDDIQRQVKSLYCAANKLRGTFDQCSPAVKTVLFRAYCMPMYIWQLWRKCTETSLKRRDVVQTKTMWERIQNIAILKQLPTHFKAKREKAAVTPFQRVPAPLHPWASEGGRRGLGSLEFGNFSKKRLFSLLRVAKTKFHKFWSP